MRRPDPRGPFGRALDRALDGPAGTAGALADEARGAVAAAAAAGRDVIDDDDVQAGLVALYELHYRGLDGVDDAWEWDPGLLSARAVLEGAFEASLRAAVRAPEAEGAGRPAAPAGGGVAAALFSLAHQDGGPSLSRHLERRATPEQWREFLVHRSVYHLKEADPHTWAVPRLAGREKVALVEIQADEYGGGRPQRMHAELFAVLLREAGLDDTYGAYVDVVPAVTLAHVNAMSLLGLHRRLRGATVGHLTMVEMSSSVPSRRLANGLRRIGLGPAATDFYDEHVEADAAHEQIAAHDLAGALVAREPHLAADVLLGARIALELEARVARHLLDRWDAGVTSLRAQDVPATRRPAPAATPPAPRERGRVA